MKKSFKNLICLILISSFLMINCIYVQGLPLNINARCAIAMDSKTKIVLYEKNSDMLVPMASTTKIMTTLVALKYGDLEKTVEISDKSANIHGSTVGYKKGEKISIKELLYGLMLRSGNDAAIAISEGISGSVDEFLKLMNEYAMEIGVCDTHFESPHGLDSEQHYCTAYDLALITTKAKENKLFNEIVQSKDVDSNAYGFTRSYHNINKILWQIPEANGVKTGYTGNAGKCLVTSVNINGNDVIFVVFNSPERWNETKKMYDFIVKNYSYDRLVKKGEVVSNTVINDKRVNLVSREDIIIPKMKDSIYTTKINIPKYQDIKLPIYTGESFGSFYVFKDGTLIYKKNLYTQENIVNKTKLKKWFFRW